MASVFFRYRSTKNKGFLTACLITGLHGKKDFQARCKIEVEKDFWNEYRKGTRFQDDDKIKLKKKLETDLEGISKFIINRFENDVNPEKINNDWLKTALLHYSNPRIAETIPTDLISYIDYYVTSRENEGEHISDTTKRRYKVVQNKLQAFQDERIEPILIKDINNSLKVDFIKFVREKKYSVSTYQRDMVHILSFARHAKSKGLETHPELDNFKVQIKPKDKIKMQELKITLSFDELDKIGKLKKLTPILKDARDFLLISAYCGQRVSDLMRFNKKMLYKDVDDDGKEQIYIKFRQEKTGALMDFQLHPKIIEILKERNGEFPQPILHQKYNRYIKQICRRAKINEIVEGSLMVKMEDGSYRKEVGMYEKWKLISSHTGRRSMATNFFRLMDREDLMYITGHSSVKTFLLYVNEKDSKVRRRVNYGNA